MGKPKEKPNTLVIDPVKGFGLEYVKKPEGRQWHYGGQWVYCMSRHDGTSKPIELSKELGILPDKLYRALFWREADILFTLQNTWLEKLNLFGLYVLISILLFFMYLIYSSM